jgi:hypothetical protein
MGPVVEEVHRQASWEILHRRQEEAHLMCCFPDHLDRANPPPVHLLRPHHCHQPRLMEKDSTLLAVTSRLRLEHHQPRRSLAYPLILAFLLFLRCPPYLACLHYPVHLQTRVTTARQALQTIQ